MGFGRVGLRESHTIQKIALLTKRSWASEGSDAENLGLFARDRGLPKGQMVRTLY